MRLTTYITFCLLLPALISSAQPEEDIERIDIEIDAQANLYYNEILDTSMVIGGAGIPPVVIDIRGVKMIGFEHAEGLVSCFGEHDSTYFGADGGAYGAMTDVHERGAISGIKHKKKTMFVTGVIFSDYSRLEPPLPAEDYTEKENYEELRPLFDRPFFIGDGKTDKGTDQRITVRRDATELYIGFADCLVGPASNYNNNRGKIKMTVVLFRGGMGRN